MVALGKSLYFACHFERKCQEVLRVLHIVSMYRDTGDASATLKAVAAARGQMLHATLEGMKGTADNLLDHSEIARLSRAREARNFVAHESGKINIYRAEHIAEAFTALRSAVVDLASGDNVISTWLFEISEKSPAPKWMTETYEARVCNWIFGDPFEEPDHTFYPGRGLSREHS